MSAALESLIKSAPAQNRAITALPVIAKGSQRAWTHARAREFVSDALESIPTIFGRLILVASFIDRKEQRYTLPVLEKIYDPAAAQKLLKDSHQDLLLRWLEMSIEIRVKDASAFFRWLGNDDRSTLRNVIRQGDCSSLLPLQVEEMHAAHFETDIRYVLRAAYAKLCDHEVPEWPADSGYEVKSAFQLREGIAGLRRRRSEALRAG